MTSLTIRTANFDDMDAILRIERSNSTAAHWNVSEYERLLRNAAVSRVCLVADRDEQVLGFVVAREVTPEWELENIAVLPEVSGQGIGSALLGTLLQRVADARGLKLMLEVRESNVRACKLYLKAGMQLSGRRKRYYSDPPEDALLFGKNLLNPV